MAKVALEIIRRLVPLLSNVRSEFSRGVLPATPNWCRHVSITLASALRSPFLDAASISSIPLSLPHFDPFRDAK
jgi:hypothetical protein